MCGERGRFSSVLGKLPSSKSNAAASRVREKALKISSAQPTPPFSVPQGNSNAPKNSQFGKKMDSHPAPSEPVQEHIRRGSECSWREVPEVLRSRGR
jgi:hypothetical protein